ncbi:dynamin family protein [Roseovarius albus]|nr:dynamin family protein [Roseovarius albus]
MHDVTNEETRLFISKIQQDLTELKPGVAFVGQIKAGKSRLINGFIGRAEFLPSDVNPWTTVITDMHFGHPSGRTDGAEFHFFDNEQWQELIAEGEEMRKLFADEEDSYKREMIEEQVDAMKNRAKLRLGASYQNLLGQTHDLPELSSDDLMRYVCAGDDPTDLDDGEDISDRGLYSDVTRKAEVYFELGHFPFPLTVTDTPGVNDPLLIREEISRQYLKKADFFVVVLSAHQALSRADLKLFRLMQALELGQLVVFINRVDELNDGAEDAAKVKEDVRKGLKQALVGSEIEVLTGSAQWAHYALTGDENGVDHDDVLAWLRANPALMQKYLDGVKDMKRGDGPVSREAILRFAAMVASGLPELRSYVTDALTLGTCGEQMQMAWQHLNSFAKGELERSEARLRAIGQEPVERGVDTLSNNETFNELRAMITEKSEGMIQDMDDVFANLRGVMDDTVGELVANVVHGPNGKSPLLAQGAATELDFTALRERMRELIQDATQVVRQRLMHELYAIDMHSNAVLQTLPGWEESENGRMNTSAVRWFRPDTSALSRGITVELRVSWLSRLFSKKSYVARANEMITQEFEMIGDDLVDTARTDIIERMETVLNHHQALLAGHFDDDRRNGAKGTNTETDPQGAFDQLRRITGELELVYGPANFEDRLAEAAE